MYRFKKTMQLKKYIYGSDAIFFEVLWWFNFDLVFEVCKTSEIQKNHLFYFFQVHNEYFF